MPACPIVPLAGTIAESFFPSLLEQFNIIGVQTQQDKERFAAVAPQAAIKVMHNMKFDQEVPAGFKSVNLNSYFGNGKHQILLAASTHLGEEKLIAEVFSAIKADFPELRLVIVPRHAERGGEIVKILTQLNLPFADAVKTMEPKTMMLRCCWQILQEKCSD